VMVPCCRIAGSCVCAESRKGRFRGESPRSTKLGFHARADRAGRIGSIHFPEVRAFPLRSRYKHAARHLLECQSLASSIQDYVTFETHDAFASRQRAKHGRKVGFWGQLAKSSGTRR